MPPVMLPKRRMLPKRDIPIPKIPKVKTDWAQTAKTSIIAPNISPTKR